MDDQYPSVRFTFVRHGQARAADDSYDEHTPLSLMGLRQAESIARALRGREPPHAIYSSPHPRCVETARPLCDALLQKPILDQRLAEFEFEKRTRAAAFARPDLLIWEPLHRDGPGGETLRQFSARIYDVLDEISLRHLGASVALFTHAGVIDAAIRRWVGLPVEAPWLHDFPLSNASITELELWPRGRVSGGAPRYTAFRRVADTSHLQDCQSDM